MRIPACPNCHRATVSAEGQNIVARVHLFRCEECGHFWAAALARQHEGPAGDLPVTSDSPIHRRWGPGLRAFGW